MLRFNQGQAYPKAFFNYFEVVTEVHSHFTITANDYRIDFSRANTLIFSMKIAGPYIWNNRSADIPGASNLYSFKKLLRAPITNYNAMK